MSKFKFRGVNKQIFTDKEQTILNYLLHDKLRDYKKCLNNPLNTDFINESIKKSILDINTIIKKIKNPNYKIKSEVL